MAAEPLSLVTGVTVTVRLAPEPPKTMLALGTRVGLDELPARVRLAAAVSVSPMVKGRAGLAGRSWMGWSAMEVMVGRSLTLVTVTVKEREKVLLAAAPSLTVMVMVAEPLALVAGLKLMAPVGLGLV